MTDGNHGKTVFILSAGDIVAIAHLYGFIIRPAVVHDSSAGLPLICLFVQYKSFSSKTGKSLAFGTHPKPSGKGPQLSFVL